MANIVNYHNEFLGNGSYLDECVNQIQTIANNFSPK
jgi:hypothetical protein